MKKATYLILCFALIFPACQKGDDYMNIQSNEKQILWASAPGQLGMTEMPSRSGLDINNLIKIQVRPDVDITALPVELAISPGATVSPASGSVQDFSKGPVEYTVISQSGKEQKFRIEVTSFTEAILGTWGVTSVDVISDMDKEYGLPRWPAPGMGQTSGKTIFHNEKTPVYTPQTDGVEMDNILTFVFSSISQTGDVIGILKTDPGKDGKTASREIISNFLEDMNVIYDTGVAYEYPEDFYWIPAEEGTTWTRNSVSGAITFSSGNDSLVCTVESISDNKVVLVLPKNPNAGMVYKRGNNGWYDRYDFAYNTVYTLERLKD